MYNRLLKDCKTEKEKNELKELVQVSAPLFKRIFKVLDEELAELEEVNWEDFSITSLKSLLPDIAKIQCLAEWQTTQI